MPHVTVERITADDPRFVDWHRVIADAYAFGREPGWWESLAATRAYFARPVTRTMYAALVAVHGERIVGGAELRLPLDADTNTVQVDLGVAPDHRNRGVGAALMRAMTDEARTYDRNVVQAEVTVPATSSWDDWPGACFARRNGLASVSTEHRYVARLPITLPDVAVGEECIVSWVGPVPDEHLSELARMQTQMNEDVPTGELSVTARQIDADRVREAEATMSEQGWTKVRTVALGPDGIGRGYTELLVSAHDPDVVVQDDTLVDRAHRGHGLGLRLKVANLRLLQEHDRGRLLGGRHTVQTYVEQDNVAMQRTNERVGFRFVDTLHECEGTLLG